MQYGFRTNTIDAIELPPDMEGPYIIDDATLAFFLGIRPKLLWWYILNHKNMYTVHKFPKRTGGTRTVYAPDENLKGFLKNIEENLLKPLQAKLGKHVTAYRPRLSTKDAVLQHIPKCPVCDAAGVYPTPKSHNCPRQGVYIHMDITNFFPSTTRAHVRRYFKSVGYTHYVSGLLADIMTIPMRSDDPNNSSEWFGVPQGAPTSGTLCNLVADHLFDGKILKYLHKKNIGLPPERQWVYTRYSDDMSITCGRTDVSKRTVARVVATVTAIIKEAGYTVNNSKTKIVSQTGRKQLLGIVFNKHPNITKESYRQVRALCHNCLTQGFEAQLKVTEKETVEELVAWLGGLLRYIASVTPRRGLQLIATYQTALVTHAIDATLSNGRVGECNG